jgi:hypothetical protein
MVLRWFLIQFSEDQNMVGDEEQFGGSSGPFPRDFISDEYESDDERYEHFPLPFSPDPTLLPVRPSPWIEQFFGLDAPGVREKLLDHFATIRHSSPAAFRHAALKYDPCAIGLDSGSWCVVLGRKHAYAERYLFLESPPEGPILERTLRPYCFGEQALIEEFYLHFYGLRNAPNAWAPARFVYPKDWRRFESYGWVEDIEKFDADRKWARSLVIYETGTGDMIVLDPVGGETAWVLLTMRPETGPFVAFTPSFGFLLETFAQNVDNISLMLDYYKWAKI